MATETTAIVKLESMTAALIFQPGTIDPILDQIEVEAREEAAKLDISTEFSRKALASLAYKVARSKTFIDMQRKNLVAEEKRRLQQIDAEGRRIWNRLEALQDEVRKPLTEWEEADKRRIATHEDALREIENAGPYSLQNWQMLTAEAIGDRLKEIDGDCRDWEEFAMKAAGVKAVARRQVYEALQRREKYDAFMAELARLRKEAQEREQREREQRIAGEAREKAERDARTAQERVEREKAEAEQRAKDAEMRVKLAHEKAERDAKEAAERFERDRRAAIKAERERAAAKAQREKEEQERREASARIRKRVIGEICDALVKIGVELPQAETVALALANNEIPHTTVRF